MVDVMCRGEVGGVCCARVKRAGVVCWGEEGEVWCARMKTEGCDVLGW